MQVDQVIIDHKLDLPLSLSKNLLDVVCCKASLFWESHSFELFAVCWTLPEFLHISHRLEVHVLKRVDGVFLVNIFALDFVLLGAPAAFSKAIVDALAEVDGPAEDCVLEKDGYDQ